jgi:ankyrin repeat protein
MSLKMDQLRVEARERDKGGYSIFMLSAGLKLPLRILKRLQFAYPAGVNTQNDDGWSALMAASHMGECSIGNVEYVDLLLEMGSSAGLLHEQGYNAFDMMTIDEAEGFRTNINFQAEREAMIAVFKKHGITSNVIPTDFISPLYYESIYFTQRVADAGGEHMREKLIGVPLDPKL